jgi:hypothetical protein
VSPTTATGAPDQRTDESSASIADAESSAWDEAKRRAARDEGPEITASRLDVRITSTAFEP